MAYNDSAVFLPGRGAVLVGDAGAERPTDSAIRAWIADGAVGTLTAGTDTYNPMGYTSLDDLPNFGAETEGGETRGAWENPALRTTATKVTDTVIVNPIQWSPTPMTHRFGPGVVDDVEGVFEVPAVYTASEVSLLVIFIDGNDPLSFHIPRVASSPEGGIEPASDTFMSLPVKYTVLVITGRPKMSIITRTLVAPVDPAA